MANSNDWGHIYCYTEFGDEDHTIAESIPNFSSPSCFLSAVTGNRRETKALTIDNTIQKVDNTEIKIDQTLITQ